MCLHHPKKWGSRAQKLYLLEVARSLILSTSFPSYLWGDVIPLECLKESYPSTRLIFYVPLWVFGCTVCVHNHGPNPSKFTPSSSDMCSCWLIQKVTNKNTCYLSLVTRFCWLMQMVTNKILGDNLKVY